MKRFYTYLLAAALVAGPAAASARGFEGDPFLGGILGGVAGAAVGSAIGGDDGALVGGALGAVVGIAAADDGYGRHHHRPHHGYGYYQRPVPPAYVYREYVYERPFAPPPRHHHHHHDRGNHYGWR